MPPGRWPPPGTVRTSGHGCPPHLPCLVFALHVEETGPLGRSTYSHTPRTCPSGAAPSSLRRFRVLSATSRPSAKRALGPTAVRDEDGPDGALRRGSYRTWFEAGGPGGPSELSNRESRGSGGALERPVVGGGNGRDHRPTRNLRVGPRRMGNRACLLRPGERLGRDLRRSYPAVEDGAGELPRPNTRVGRRRSIPALCARPHAPLGRHRTHARDRCRAERLPAQSPGRLRLSPETSGGRATRRTAAHLTPGRDVRLRSA
jgi:hypothetical protein